MLHFLTKDLWFPPVEQAQKDGLLAVGGDLGTERLLLAYRHGIFPWYGDDSPPMWWCPDPRFIMLPSRLKVSKSMRQVVRKGEFEFRINNAFEQVIHNCRTTYREGQPGTWITADVARAYTRLHHIGHAHSAEAWHNGALAGGLYGIWLGRVFFGESMFAHRSNASKFAFISWVQYLIDNGVQLIDCQVHTPHLESLGAEMISRKKFMKMLDELI